MSERSEKAQERYRKAAHAMQSGVKFLMESEPGLNYPESGECSPKHLRTGVNSALVDSGALAGLLIRKGLISEEEYFEVLAEIMEKDVKSYEEKLSRRFGKPTHLL